MPPLVHPDLAPAQDHLHAADPVLAGLIDRIGPCTLYYDTDHFAVLCRAIIGQQISTAAAKSITLKLETFCEGTVTPARIAEATDEELRACGLSAVKQKYIRSIADKAVKQRKTWKKMATMPDDEVAAFLLPIAGVGPWTVEMFLMFALGRPDVLPCGDLGVCYAVRDLYGLGESPKPAALTKIAEPWRPYRSIACWYLWRTRGVIPQSGEHS